MTNSIVFSLRVKNPLVKQKIDEYKIKHQKNGKKMTNNEFGRQVFNALLKRDLKDEAVLLFHQILKD